MDYGSTESPLTIPALCEEAGRFALHTSRLNEPDLFGTTDGKAVGTYLEQRFKAHLRVEYRFDEGNAASGIDLPDLRVDIKTTSIQQPQSSSPFRSARQKVYGLGYALLIFVYEKHDDVQLRTARLNILHVIFVEAWRTGDYQTTTGLLRILENGGNEDDLVAFMEERRLPLDYDTEGRTLAREIILQPPDIGYLTISNALQWRLQYGRAIGSAGDIDGVLRLR